MIPVIRQIRRDARITQQKMADDFKKSVLTIKRWEKGISEPPFSLICMMAKKYELNILRYTFSADDIQEMCNRGFAEYALKIEQGLYMPCETLFALNERDWDTAQKIRDDELAESISCEIWTQITDPLLWGRTPEISARSAYDYHENERWEGLAKTKVISKLKNKFKPLFDLP